MMPLAYTVRQCRLCRRILRYPLCTMLEGMAEFPHCDVPTEYLETISIEQARLESVHNEEVAHGYRDTCG